MFGKKSKKPKQIIVKGTLEEDGSIKLNMIPPKKVGPFWEGLFWLFFFGCYGIIFWGIILGG